MCYQARRPVTRCNIRALFLPLFLLTTLNGCSDSPNQPVTTNGSGQANAAAGPVAVFPDVVIQQLASNTALVELAAANLGATELFSNGNFEQGTSGWFSCDGGQKLTTTADAFQGSNALQVAGGTCFYGTAQALPGDELVLTCAARVADATQWAGLGLGFASSEWKVIGEGPTSLVTSEKYARYSVRALAPEDTGYVSMWFYSESQAAVDSCSLTVVNAGIAEQEPKFETQVEDTPIISTENLLDDSIFTGVPGTQPDGWYRGCNKMGTATITNNAALKAEKQYADLVIGFDGVETAQATLENGTFMIQGTAPDKASNGFVGVYSELSGGASVQISQCTLLVTQMSEEETNEEGASEEQLPITPITPEESPDPHGGP